MFKSKQSMAVLALFTSQAVAIKYRPPAGTVPWGSAATLPEWKDPQDHKVNYFIPNFGEDAEISTSKKNLAVAEETLKHQLQASFDPPASFKKNYFVPHFGEDADIKATKSNIAAAEKKYNHVYDTSPPPADPPRNYFVPNFGEDNDIKATKKNIAAAEAKFGHQLDTSTPDEPKRNYFVPNFGEDAEITAAKKNLAAAESKFGKLNVHVNGNGGWTLLQTDADLKTESDPICSSAGCT